MLTSKLRRLLKEEKVPYEIVTHAPGFSSQEIAATEHISGKEIAKVVMVNIEGEDVMMVIPANRVLDLLKLSAAFGTDDIRIEDEKEFADLFRDCEIGAMPPVGRLYDIPCYVDRSMFEKGEVCFNGGNHRESVKMSAEDFRRIADAEIGDFAVESGVMA